MTAQQAPSTNAGRLGAIDRLLGTGARPAAPARPRPPAPPVRHTVVVGADTTAAAVIAVDHAAIEADLRGWDLRIVHAQPGATTTHGRSIARDRGAALLERMSDRVHADTSSVAVTSRLAVGAPATCLLDEAAGEELLVVGASHTRATGLLAGATSVETAARHRGTVLVARAPSLPPRASWAARPIVAGYDGSPWAERAVRFAIEEARLRGCELSVLWSLPSRISRSEGRARLARFNAEVSAAGVVARLHEIEERAQHRFVLESEHAAAVVVGSRGNGGFTGPLLGSVSRALIHDALCPVFIVH